MSPLYISNSMQNSTNCPKSVIIHITKRHSFIVLFSLHSVHSVYAYMNMRITVVTLLRVHNSNAVRAALAAKACMSAGYQREPVARCHETHFTAGVCGCICRSVWHRGRRSRCSCRRLAVISVVVVTVCRLQRRRVSARGMTNGTQELESRIRPVIKLGQTGLDSRLVYDVSFAFWAVYV